MKAKPTTTDKYTAATGRRKTAVATVRIFDAVGELTINDQPAKNYFSSPFLLDTATEAFKATGRGKTLRTTVHVRGGGKQAQAEAVSLGLARALLKMDEALKLPLRKNGLLTRDSREKERKKPGLKRARKAPQWAKR